MHTHRCESACVYANIYRENKTNCMKYFFCNGCQLLVNPQKEEGHRRMN